MEFKAKDVVCTVSKVYFNIPDDESATGFEIAVEGTLRIVKENEDAFVHWSPLELTVKDVRSLFSAGSEDAWTIIENNQIDVSDLTVPKPILENSSPSTKPRVDKGETGEEEKKQASVEKSSEGGLESSLPKKTPPARPPPPKGSSTCQTSFKIPIHFPIKDLKSIHTKKDHSRGSFLVFYLTTKEVKPPLYFQDGGTEGFISQLQRFTYLVRSGTDLDLLVVEEFSRFEQKGPPKPSIGRTGRDGISKPVTGDGGIISTVAENVVGEFSKVTKLLKSNILQVKPMPEQRPGAMEEDEEEKEVEAATIVCHKARLTSKGSQDPESSLVGDFQLIDDVRALLPPLPGTHPRRDPITREVWELYRDFDGRISAKDEQKFRVHAFTGGIAPDLRREVWKYLLGFFSFQETDFERMIKRQKKEEEYFVLKRQWQSMTETQIRNFSAYRECSQLIHKDVVRTDREMSLFRDLEGPKIQQMEEILHTYLIYNVDLGYVQGMSDLLAPVLSVMDNEIDAFWCFVGYMDMVHKYFEKSQQRTRDRLKVLRLLLSVQELELYDFLKDCGASNMFFAFRWLLVNFKREFPYNDVMSLWEAIWSCVLSPDYALFIALAILGKYKEEIVKEEDQSGIIRYINDLSMKMDVNELLKLAEVYCLQLHLAESLPEELQALLVQGGKDVLFSNLPTKVETVDLSSL